jgi:hypothetical protein
MNGLRGKSQNSEEKWRFQTRMDSKGHAIEEKFFDSLRTGFISVQTLDTLV